MAKIRNKYCYVIVDKENASFLDLGKELPIYWDIKIAKQICADYKGYVVHKILIDDIEKLILKSKKA